MAAIALTGSAILGLLTTYVLALLIVVSLVTVAVRGRLPWTNAPDELVFTGVFAALLITFLLSSGLGAGAASAFNFLAFLLYGPVSRAMTAARRDDGIVFVARMALAGVAIALGICLFQFAVLGIARPPGIASDTIRLANTAVIMGFFCLAGFSKETGRMRLIYLIGPALALGVVIFTGTRIAMVTYPAVLVVSVLLLAPPRFRLPILGGGVAVLGAVAVGLWLMGNRRFMSIFDAIQTLSSGKDLPDVSIKTRLNLYRAAWTAFQESPLVGHGWSNMMKVTIPLMPDAQRYAQGLPHLHNELLSLAVSAGLVGVACYGVLLITPLVLAIRSIQDSQRTQRIYCMVVLITAYAFMGLTDTMLTFEMHTMLYVVLCAIILRFCRDRDIPQLAG